jgi:hypothetical protein
MNGPCHQLHTQEFSVLDKPPIHTVFHKLTWIPVTQVIQRCGIHPSQGGSLGNKPTARHPNSLIIINI